MIINAVTRSFDIKDNYIKNIQKKAETVLDKRYFRLFNLYMDNIINGKYEYIVLVTRRAYVLYEIFVICLLNQGVDIRDKVKIITSDAIFMLDYFDKNPSESYKNKGILILDDIIINGRTVHAVYDRLVNVLECKKVHIVSMEIYEEAKYLNSIKDEKLMNVPKVSEKIWKKDSDLLTDLIVSCNIGYTSFIPSYIFDDFSIEEWNKLINELMQEKTLKEMKTETLQKNGIDAYVLFLDIQHKSKLNFLDDDKTEICIRLYYNQNDQILTIIPYVFLDNISTDNCIDFCNYFFGKYDYEISSDMLQFLKQDDHHNEKLALLYKFTICFLCKKVFEEFSSQYFKEYDNDYYIKDPQEYYCSLTNDEFVCKKSKPGNFSKPNEDQFDFVEDSETNYHYYSSKEVFISFANNNAAKYKKTYKTILINYLNSIKIFDDENANKLKNEPRCVGIRIIDIINGLLCDNHNVDENREILLSIIELWDEGTAAYNYMALECKNEKYAICGVMRNGEQIYNKIYLLYKKEYSYFYRFYHKTSCYQFPILEHFATFMTKRTSNYNFINLFKAIKNGSEDHYYVDLACVVPDEFCHKWDDSYDAYLHKYIYK